MNPVQELISSLLPRRTKATPSGWTSLNAPCCIYRGHSKDTKKRGGFRFDNQGFIYHCFNCDFKAGWSPGKLLSSNTKGLLKWLGTSDEDISKLSLYTLKNKETIEKETIKLYKEFREIQLPPDTYNINYWAEQGESSKEFIESLEYILSRGLKFDWYPWHWSSSPGYRDRIIMPFYDNGKIVGWSGRKINGNTLKYLTHAQPGYVFNIDNQYNDREYCLVLEGQLDAISVDGVAVMSNNVNSQQIAKINSLEKQVILVPDQDAAGAELIKVAIENKWAISCPNWYDCKDTNDAVKQYGRIYTLHSIINNIETNSVKIQLIEKKLKSKNKA
jgi:5S rRNA maturation endonuclease (ribonuclease M5)